MTTQIVIAKLASIDSTDEFISLTQSMLAWLKKQPGFIDYQLFIDGNNISDIVTYESKEAATEIVNHFRETDIYSNIISLLDSDYSNFFGENIHLN